MVRPRTYIFWGLVALTSIILLVVLATSGGGGDGTSGTDRYSTPMEKDEETRETAGSPGSEPGSAQAPAVVTGGGVIPPPPATVSQPGPVGEEGGYTALAPPLPTAVRTLGSGAEVPGPAAVFVFEGYGRAHGVGLCMDGVKYRALAGHSHMDIINHYYTGVELGRVDDSMPIRVKGRDGRVRTLPLIEYLYRLTEEPEDYPIEGLKVLYIAARTYTLSVIARGKHTGQGFDICSSGSCCQAFSENKDLSKFPNNIAAADATGGLVLLHDGRPIVAAYHGSCGGHTDNNEDVWGTTPLPYLRGKPDAYCSQSPRFSKTVEISAAELERRFNASSDTRVGTLRLVDLSDRTPGGRVRKVRIYGSGGVREVPGSRLASMLGLSGTRYTYTFR